MAKVLISVREAQLKRIDSLARASGKSRSAFLVERALTPDRPGSGRPIDDPRVRRAYERILAAPRGHWKPGPDTLTLIREQREHGHRRLSGH